MVYTIIIMMSFSKFFCKERLWMIVRGLRLVRNGANCIKYIDGKGVAQCCPLQTKCLQDRSEEEDEGSSDGDEPRWSNDRHWTGSRGAAGHMLCTCYNLLMVSRCYFQLCLNCYFQFLLSKIIQLMHCSWPSRIHDVNGCHDTRAAPGCVVAGWKEKARARERALAPLKAKLSRPPPWASSATFWRIKTGHRACCTCHILPPIIHHVEMMETYIYIFVWDLTACVVAFELQTRPTAGTFQFTFTASSRLHVAPHHGWYLLVLQPGHGKSLFTRE